MPQSPEVEHLHNAILAARKVLKGQPLPHAETEAEVSSDEEQSETPMERLRETAQRLRDAQ
jgi:hypothetical protein